MKSIRLAAFALALILGISTLIPASAQPFPDPDYDFPSTNDYNQANGLPYVYLVDTGLGDVTLGFMHSTAHTNVWSAFEYRIDGQVVSGEAHPVLAGDVKYPYVCVQGNGASCPVGPVTQTFYANDTVEIRLAYSNERDYDFDWITFYVGQDPACDNAWSSDGSSGNDALGGGDGPDSLNGRAGNDVLCGFGGGDSLKGGSGNDYIVGANGDDVLTGNSGNDTMTGGNGADVFKGGSGYDTVTDFECGVDSGSSIEEGAC